MKYITYLYHTHFLFFKNAGLLIGLELQFEKRGFPYDPGVSRHVVGGRLAATADRVRISSTPSAASPSKV